jgi:hypothetical protein
MLRTLNYTGRKQIERADALFSFTDNSDVIPEFNVLLNLDEKSYPIDSVVYVEAHYKETRQRYCFGALSKLTPPSDRKLSDIDLSGPTLFRVLIVDESGRHGLLLASGEGFRADGDGDDDNKSSILSVVTRPLGQLTWKVEFETGSRPELCLNNCIPNAIEKMRVDPVFQALVLPAALREVLMYFLWNEDDDSEHSQHWMSFAELLAEAKPESNDPSEMLNWIGDVVAEFSQRFGLANRLVNSVKEDLS